MTSELISEIQEQTLFSDDFLNQVIDQTQSIRRESDREKVKEQLNCFLAEVLSGSVVISNDIIGSIEQRIAEIDDLLSSQVSLILHAPEYQKQESIWRGLHKLVQSSITENTKIRMLQCTREELIKDFKTASDFDQSTLFKCIYENEYGTFGGTPFAAFVGDFQFDNTPQDIALLEHISHVAAAAHAPFLSAISPGMLSMKDYSELHRPRDLAKMFETTDYARWHSFRQSDDSRYIGLTLPRVLGRIPYGVKTIPAETFIFEEHIREDESGRDYLWINSAWELAGRIVESFEEYGWCASIRGVEGGGLVKSLPAYNYNSISGERTMQCPTQVAISDRREKELSDLGFIPLVYCKGTDYAAFFAVNSINKPRVYDSTQANANARLSSQLPYIFATSRFAHYLKSIVRDKVGSFTSRADCEEYLQKWIMQYVVASDNAGPETKARYPLREAKIEVIEVDGYPGLYRAIVWLKPHFQLEGLSLSLRLVASLPTATN
ncbi:type VI secretion system contractile sheath large subunit [Salmonella enterica]|nr:type VI secretion system contractile sheath large subunit [Salmonella enterica]EEJ9029341.1 type VI secretion system contractile sheath large subunit [Salmonella enterica subsp. enterica]